MIPDASWGSAMKVSKNFADVKPLCTGEKLLFEVLGEDFNAAIVNLKWPQDQTATHGFHVKKGLLVGNSGPPRIKIQHVLFEVILFSILCNYVSNKTI